MSGDLGELSEELQSLQALRRSSSGSRCIHEHHCGSQVSVNSLKAGQGAHGLGRGSMELPSFRGDFQSSLPPLGDLSSSLRKKSWPSMKPGRMQGHHVMGDRVMGRQDRVMEEDEEDDEDGRYDVYVRRGGSRRGNFEMAQQRSLSMDFWEGKTRLTRCAETTFRSVSNFGGRTFNSTPQRGRFILCLPPSPWGWETQSVTEQCSSSCSTANSAQMVYLMVLFPRNS